MKRAKSIIPTVLLSLCLGAGEARGGVPVYDGANHMQNILTAIRTLQSNVNEATQIANQIQSLANEARNLLSLEFSTVEELRSKLNGLFAALGRVKGSLSDFNTLEAEFQRLYPEFDKQAGKLSGENLSQAAAKWLQAQRELLLSAALTGAKVLDNLPESEAHLTELLESSAGSMGILQAAQAGNEIGAQVASELVALNAAVSTYQRAHLAYLSTEVAKDAAAQNRLRHVLDGYENLTSEANPVQRRPY